MCFPLPSPPKVLVQFAGVGLVMDESTPDPAEPPQEENEAEKATGDDEEEEGRKDEEVAKAEEEKATENYGEERAARLFFSFAVETVTELCLSASRCNPVRARARQRPSGPEGQANRLPHTPTCLCAAGGKHNLFLNPEELYDRAFRRLEMTIIFFSVFVEVGVVLDGAEPGGDR